MFRLDNKVALVTGGSRGIGRGIAEALAAQGATVVVNYVKGQAAADEVVAGIVGRGGKAEALGFDVGDSAAAEKAVEALAKRHGRLDILVANAGIAIDGLLLRLNDEDLDRMFQINVKGAIACAKAATRSMMRARSGRVIFISSVIGEMGNVGQTGYAATKAAMLGVTKSLAREYAGRKVTVNAITPGFIDTEMTQAMNEAAKEQVLKAIPLGRTGTAADIAAACVYLASDEAAYVTGQTLRVNGGMYI
jgi:3-oxoacyl-[acyl-carrier protein] reductase